MKKIFLSVSIILFAAMVSAQHVNLSTAKRVAENYFVSHTASVNAGQKAPALLKFCQIENNDTLFYIFNIAGDGFVIVAGDYKISPILAFSDEGNFDVQQQSPALSNWLEGYADYINYAKLHGQTTLSSAWDLYSNNQSSTMKINDPKDITPLVTTKWNQGSGYNFHCPQIPTGPDGRCYAGCVATAMAQIMKYYNFPEHGTGSHAYYHPYFVSISANFDTTYYDWVSMSNSLNSTSKEAISTLIFQCGVSVDMNYMPNGSGANMSMVPPALKTYFDYRPSVHLENKSGYTIEEWREILYDELEVSHPVMYSGSGSAGGHAWVCDGVKDSTLFHFNWGWSGSNNGYFALDNINSGNGDFTNGQQAVIDFVPVNAPYCMANRVHAEPSKTITDGSGYSLYWNDTQCEWLIQPPGADKIVLTFNKFKTEAQKDMLSVYDGSTTLSPLLGTFSGPNLPPTLIANSGTMLITFTSDGQNQDEGWEATYTSVISGIHENSVADDFVIYPVPANNSLNIKFSGSLNGSGIMNIFTITGQLVKSETIKFDNNNSVIDISTLSQGIYTIDIHTDNYCIHKKFIKE